MAKYDVLGRVKLILKAIEQSDGKLKDVSEKSGLPLIAVYRYFYKYDEIKMAVYHSRIKSLQIAISALKDQMRRKHKAKFLYESAKRLYDGRTDLDTDKIKRVLKHKAEKQLITGDVIA